MRNSNGAYARKVRGDARKVFQGEKTVAEIYQEVLDNAYEDVESKAKTAARDHGATPRAAENWLSGDNAPTLEKFLIGYHTNPKVKAWVRKLLLLEEDHDPEFQAQLARFIQAAQRVGT
jgi:hypothetical protein